MSLRCFVTLTLTLVAFSHLTEVRPATAQDAAAGDAPAIELSPDQQESKIDPQVLQLNEMAARGGTNLAVAIEALVRVRRWSDADRWLAEGVAPINDQSKLAVIADIIGPELLLRVSMHPTVSAEAKAAVVKLGKAARASAESKDKLIAAIDRLDDSSIDRRLGAARTLLGGGDVAVAALVESAVAVSPTAPRDEVLRIMLKLGGDGTQAIRQFALYGQGDFRFNALKSLARIDRKAALPDLVTAMHDADASAAELQLASDQVRRVSPAPPTKSEAIAYLYSELKRARQRAAETENEYQTVPLWSLSADRQSVSVQHSRAILLAYRDAVDAAARLRRIGATNPRITDASLAADLAYRVMIGPDWGTAEQIKRLRDTYGDSVDAAGLSHAIQLANEAKDYPALVGLLRMVAVSDHELPLERTIMLNANSPKITPLVAAVMHSEPRVRYEAAAAIARLQSPDQVASPSGYPGSSYVARCLSEMRNLHELPLALLVETRADVVLRQEQNLRRLGYRVEVVGSVGQLERCVARGGDMRLILAKTQLWDYPPVELIDRVRRMPLGGNVPIVFYGAEAEGIDTERWHAVSRLIDKPKTPAAFGNLLMDLELIDRLPSMTDSDRQRYRQIATEYLGQ